jgi:glycosyltransferase involved in cell wall biosynthesis
MKIGLFIPNATFDMPGSAEVGGIEVYAFELGEALLKRGHDVVLFGGAPKAGRIFRPTPMQVQLAPYIETRHIWKFGTRFRKLIQRLHFASSINNQIHASTRDVMLVFKPYDFINAYRWKLKQPNLRVVMNYQGKDFFPTDGFWRRFIDWEYAASAENAELALQRFGSRPEVFPNGVDTNLFHPPANKPAVARLKILTAGRIVGWKGLHTLLPVLAAIPQLEWHVAGEGPERPSLEADAASLGIKDRVTFHGVLASDALAALMQRCHLFAQPSIDFDACPTAVLQAMSSGMPTLISDQVGHQSSFKQNEELLVLPARDSHAWTRFLGEVVRKPSAELDAIGARARAAIEHSFSWDTVACKLEQSLIKNC